MNETHDADEYLHPFERVLRGRFGGVIAHGKHDANGEACVFEIAACAMGLAWTDSPGSAGLPGLRPVNDARWTSAALRT